MLISSYEGVIKPFNGEGNIIDKINLKKDLKAIREYIDNNGTFLLMTKYKPNYIIETTDKLKIPYNYISYYDGLVTLDDSNNIINEEIIDKNIVRDITKIVKELKLESNVNYYNKDGITTLSEENGIILIEILVSNLVNIARRLKEIDVGHTINTNGIKLHNKKNKIELIETIKEATNQDVITMISDYKSDISALQKYNGYCITKGNIDRNNLENINSVPNIRTLIKKIK